MTPADPILTRGQRVTLRSRPITGKGDVIEDDGYMVRIRYDRGGTTSRLREEVLTLSPEDEAV